MKCAVHSEVDATGYCRNCGKPMCSTCARPVREVLYCEDCLATVMGHPPAAAARPAEPPPAAVPPPSPYGSPYGATSAAPSAYGMPPAAAVPPGGRSSPAAAFILAFVFPGLGAIYNRQYNKGLIYIAIFASLILGITSGVGNAEPVLGILLAGLIFYSAFEAMQTAQARNRGEVPSDPLESWSKDRPVVPIILIGLGALLLLGNFVDIWEHLHLGQFWPLILIGVGVYMFRNRLAGR